MANEAFKLMGVVGADVTGADRNLTKINRGLKTTEQGFNSADRAAGKFFRGAGSGGGGGLLSGLSHVSNIIQSLPAIGGMARALLDPLVDATEQGIRFNATLESALTGFEGVAGGAQGAQKHLDRLLGFAAKTPFEFTGLLKSSRYMSTFGFAIDEHIPKLTSWGNAVSAAGDINEETLEGVVRAFGQMKSKGRVSAEEMEQLAERGIPAWELLAKAIGKTVAQTRKLSEQGKLKGPEAVEAITAMINEDPRFKDQMSKQSKTLNGLLSNAADLRAQAQGLATQNLTADLKAALESGLSNAGLVEAMAGSINTAIAPVSGLVRASAVGLLGGGITSGLVEGILAGKTAVSAAGVEMGMDLLGKFTSLMGINSPSTVFMYYGEMMGAGLALGLRKGIQQQDPLGELEQLSQDPRVRALLDVIKRAEGGGLRTLYGGGQWEGSLDQFPQWGGKRFWNNKLKKYQTTHAAGFYQFQPGTYADMGSKYGLPSDFSERTQDLHALALLKEIGALKTLFTKGFTDTIPLLGTQWAAIPGPLGGPTDAKFNPRTLEKMYAQSLGDPALLQSGPGTQDGSEISALTHEIDELQKAIDAAAPIYSGNRVTVTESGEVLTGDPSDFPTKEGERVVQIDAQLTGAARQLAIEMAVEQQKQMERLAELTSRLERLQGTGSEAPEAEALGLPGLMGDVAGPLAAVNRLLPGTHDLTFQARLEMANLNAEILGTADSFQQSTLAAGEWGQKVIDNGGNIMARLEEVQAEIPSLTQQLGTFFVDAPSTVGQFFGDAARQFDGTWQSVYGSVLSGFQNMLAQMSAQLMESAVSSFLLKLGLSAIGGASGGWTSASDLPGGSVFNYVFGGARAAGGPVSPGSAYLVGEEGPELFMPRSSGSIVPHGESMDMLGGSGGFTKVEIHVHGVQDARSFQQSEGQIGRRAGMEIERTRRRLG